METSSDRDSSPSKEKIIIDKLQEILSLNNIREPIDKVEIKNALPQGENLASKAECVTIHFNNPQLRPLHLFMKTEIDNPAHNSMLVESKFFEKEGRFFLEYVPAAREFCTSKGQAQLLDIYPKCYYGNNQMTIFENLVMDRGFVLLDKVEQQDFELAKIALVTLAKHHAISFAFIKNIGGSQLFFEKFPNLDYEGFDRPSARNMIESAMEGAINTHLVDYIEKSMLEGCEKAKSFLSAHRGKSFELFMRAADIHPEEANLLVLNHGDYWNNNMMYKFDEMGKVTNHVTFDLQITRYGNLCLDLHYFMYTSVKPAVRRGRLNDLLLAYLNTINSVSHDLGYPMNLTIDELFLNFRKKLDYGFWFGILLTHGLSFIVRKDVNPAELEDLSDFAKHFDKLTQKWLESHPDERSRLAKETIELVDEYSQLMI